MRNFYIEPFLEKAKVSWINWQDRDLNYFDIGGYSVVYRPGPGLIAKVGFIEPEEVEIQRYLAGKNLALPVIDYEQEVVATKRIRKSVCSVHGDRPVVANTCTCKHPVSVLLMPEASPTSHIPTEGVIEFMNKVLQICTTELDFIWDYKTDNIGFYQGRLVALDFGEPGRQDW